MWDVRLGRDKRAQEEMRAERLERAKRAVELRRVQRVQDRLKVLWDTLSRAARQFLRRRG